MRAFQGNLFVLWEARSVCVANDLDPGVWIDSAAVTFIPTGADGSTLDKEVSPDTCPVTRRNRPGPLQVCTNKVSMLRNRHMRDAVSETVDDLLAVGVSNYMANR